PFWREDFRDAVRRRRRSSGRICRAAGRPAGIGCLSALSCEEWCGRRHAECPAMSDLRQLINLTVNGSLYEVLVEPRHTLADTIRSQCGLTGTHLGCEHGVCGACNVLLDG